MPGTDIYGQNVPYPKLQDKPNIEAEMSALVNASVPLSNMTFANANTRAAQIPNPVVGMETYLVAEGRKEVYTGSSWVAIVTGSPIWTTPVLATGYGSNGNNNGVPQYRVVNFFGDLTVMWRGGLNVSYSGGFPVNSGNFLRDPLPGSVRPISLRTVTGACSAVSSNSLSVKVDFTNVGTTILVTETGVQPPWVSLNNIMYSLT